MKKIKIRYIEDKKGCFEIQRRTVFGWRYLTFKVCTYGGCVMFRYTEKTKNEILKKVLNNYYRVCDTYITIIEYPSLRIY
jgi:hypothetical protein